MLYTSRFNLKKPETTDAVNIADLNGNADILDAALVSLTGTETLTNKTLTSPKINENVVLTATATELNYVDGVTSAIQTQINTKAPVDSPTFTTIVTAPTNTTYTTRQVRNCVLSTADASGGQTGDIWFKYTP